MLKQWKFKTTKNQNVFFTSDQHWGHNKEFLYKKRGYNSINEHDESLVTEWNKRIRTSDIVISLGDWCLNFTEQRCLDMINKLNGHIYYLFGNHNSRVKDIYKNLVFNKYGLTDEEVYPVTYHHATLGEKFTFIGDYMEGYVDNQAFVACHYAFRVWNYMAKSSVCITGHSHGNCREINKEYKNGKILDVSIENFGSPISFQEIMRIMNTKSISVVDHHGDKEKQKEEIIKKEEIIEDGFGGCWSKKCARCGKMTMEVVRPGKVQCGVCG